ncbi:tetratricopeptide repeat protein, partial [Candidatus Saccharibacteria bacterium]|nr:tetratricopeptide repeat protein [Candidatus Saccharibacteria bacterium]
LHLGVLYSTTQEYDKAKETLKQLLERNPSDATAHFYLGVIYMETKDLEDAEK